MRRNGNVTLFVLGLISGLTVGTLVALLTTPYTGEEMRGKIASESRAVRKKIEEIRKQLQEDLKGETNERMKVLRDKLDKLFDSLEEWFS